MTKQSAQYGVGRSAEELAGLHVPIENSGGWRYRPFQAWAISARFLSEFERGKETAELGKALKALHTLGLEVVIQPRKAVKPRSQPP